MTIRRHGLLAHASAWALASASIAEVAMEQARIGREALIGHVCPPLGAGCLLCAGCWWFTLLPSVQATAHEFVIRRGAPPAFKLLKAPSVDALAVRETLASFVLPLSVHAHAKKELQAFNYITMISMLDLT